MGLQVWLPLNGNLNNQGLTNIVFTNTGATVDSNGKIGSCYYFSSQSLYNTDFNWTSTNWSICYWVKYTSLPSGSNFYQLTLNGSTSSDYTFMLGGYSSNGTTGVFRCNLAGDCGTINIGIWYHVCATYNGTSCKIYVNGTLLKTFNITVNTGKKHLVINGRANNTAGTSFTGLSGVCYLNDVRIYDNCLSDKEVKEISNGLILHYPLNRNGWGQDNLATCVTPVYNIAASTSSNYNYIWINNNTLEPNTTYTFSAEVTVSDLDKCTVYNYTASGKSGSINHNFPADGKRHSWTFTTTSDAIGFIAYAGNSGATSGHSAVYKNIKIEKGDKATPYIPRAAESLYTTMDIGGTTEYDISGYQNNGERSGSFSWNADSPKYNISQVFGGSQYIVESNEISTTDSTISLWIKSALAANCHILDARNSSEIGKQPIYQYTNGSIQTGGNNKYVTTNTGLLTANTWVHIVLVQDGDSLLVYKNGNLFQTLSCTNSPIIKPTVGARLNFANKYTGQLSDARIYVTALSAEDVLALYENRL